MADAAGRNLLLIIISLPHVVITTAGAIRRLDGRSEVWGLRIEPSSS